VNTAGTVYVTDYYNNRVLKLPAGSTTPAELPFTGLSNPLGVAVDTAGTVYVTDYYRVFKLPAG
jgi:DNA-binding beta-propeller fold protein YncE